MAGRFGLLAVSLFLVSFLVFGSLHKEFNYLDDYVSELGAQGQPYSLWFNIFGFLLVGIAMAGFGITYGRYLKDNLAGLLLAFFGFGFALTSIPINPDNSHAPLSKAHTVAITLGLASWLFGLARISYNPSLKRVIRFRANVAAILLVSAMIGFAAGLWSMPITHRLVFAIVFGWTAITALGLLRRARTVEIS